MPKILENKHKKWKKKMQSTYFLKLSTITIPPPHPKKKSIPNS